MKRFRLRHPPASARERQRGSATIVVLALVVLTLACVLSASRALQHLRGELQLLDQRQRLHWESPRLHPPAAPSDVAGGSTAS